MNRRRRKAFILVLLIASLLTSCATTSYTNLSVPARPLASGFDSAQTGISEAEPARFDAPVFADRPSPARLSAATLELPEPFIYLSDDLERMSPPESDPDSASPLAIAMATPLAVAAPPATAAPRATVSVAEPRVVHLGEQPLPLPAPRVSVEPPAATPSAAPTRAAAAVVAPSVVIPTSPIVPSPVAAAPAIVTATVRTTTPASDRTIGVSASTSTALGSAVAQPLSTIGPDGWRLRRVESDVQTRVVLRFAGSGWSYVGRESSAGDVTLERMSRDSGDDVFEFSVSQPGEYQLWFQQETGSGALVNERVSLDAVPALSVAAPTAIEAPPTVASTAARAAATEGSRVATPAAGATADASTVATEEAVTARTVAFAPVASALSDRELLTLAQRLEEPGPDRDLRRALELYEQIVSAHPFSDVWDAGQARVNYLRRHYFDIR